jgi:hypothetical protein
MQQIVLQRDPFVDVAAIWWDRGLWPAKWIGHPKVLGTEPAVTAYRCHFTLDKSTALRLHVSADERYELFLDGKRLGRGPQRSDPEHWRYETYEGMVSAGKHTLVARTWWLGPTAPAPCAQMSVCPAFLLAAEGAMAAHVNTGTAAWTCKRLAGYSFPPVLPDMLWFPGARVHIKGEAYPWGVERGEGEGWEAPQVLQAGVNALAFSEAPNGWLLEPALLPAMLDEPRHVGMARQVEAAEGPDTRPVAIDPARHLQPEAPAWGRLLRGEGVVAIPPNTRRRVIIDLQEYYLGYPCLTTSGGAGALVRLLWAETLFEQPRDSIGIYDIRPKGNRDAIDGKYFVGIGDTFEPDGGEHRTFETLWYEAGRYIEAYVQTAEAPLTIESMLFHETRYPHHCESYFEASDERLEKIAPIARRTFEMCSHETFMDCPYYEQLQYAGDTAVEMLINYVSTRDDRLARQAIVAFDYSRRSNGLTQARYPSRIPQMIPPFALSWVRMVYDYAHWRSDLEFVERRLTGVRGVLDAYTRLISADGLVVAPMGWNFQDWVPAWKQGLPPAAHSGVNGILNWQAIIAFQQAALLESLVGQTELGEYHRRVADRIADSMGAFWDPDRALYADDLQRTSFSEHAQALAILSGRLDEHHRALVGHNLLNDANLERATFYFSFYLFEAYRLLGRVDKLIQRLAPWFEMSALGLRTTPEMPEPTRSDCHAWSAHPLFHFAATILGVRPAGPGFRTVRIQPQLGPLKSARGTVAHKQGLISVDVQRNSTGPGAKVSITLPPALVGELRWGNQVYPLRSGVNEWQG